MHFQRDRRRGLKTAIENQFVPPLSACQKENFVSIRRAIVPADEKREEETQ
jgi:hypothetical protein